MQPAFRFSNEDIRLLTLSQLDSVSTIDRYSGDRAMGFRDRIWAPGSIGDVG